MEVRGITPVGGYGVDVDVQRERRRGVQCERPDSRFFTRFPEGDLLARGLAGLGVAARLQPASQFAVVEQQHARAVSRQDEGAGGEMPLRDAPVEGVGIGRDEGDDGGEVGRFLGPFGSMAAQPVQQSGRDLGPQFAQATVPRCRRAIAAAASTGRE